MLTILSCIATPMIALSDSQCPLQVGLLLRRLINNLYLYFHSRCRPVRHTRRRLQMYWGDSGRGHWALRWDLFSLYSSLGVHYQVYNNGSNRLVLFLCYCCQGALPALGLGSTISNTQSIETTKSKRRQGLSLSWYKSMLYDMRFQLCYML